MPEKKFNHIIPKCLLKHWNVKGDNYIGVHTYKIVEKKFEFSSATGKKAFSFAGSNDFYVPKVDKERYLGIENFFGEGENVLAKVINQLTKNKNESFLENRAAFDNFLKALISLKFRTKWFLTNFEKHITNESIQRNLLDENLNKDTFLLILEGMMNTIQEEYLSYQHCKIFVGFSEAGDFIIGDEPFIGGDYTTEHDVFLPSFPYNFVVLSPNHLIGFKKQELKSEIEFIDYSDEIVRSFNNTIAEQSRYWLVSKTKENLSYYIDEALKEKPEVDLALRKTKFLEFKFKIK